MINFKALGFTASAFGMGWANQNEDSDPDVGECINCRCKCKMSEAHPTIWYGDYEIDGPICLECADVVGRVSETDGEFELKPNFWYDLDNETIVCACPDVRITERG